MSAELMMIVSACYGGRQAISLATNIQALLEMISFDNAAVQVIAEAMGVLEQLQQRGPSMLEETAAYCNNLIDRAERVFNSPAYRARFNLIMCDATEVVRDIPRDPVLKAFRTDALKLLYHMLVDDTGSISAKRLRVSLRQLKPFVVPIILKELERVPLDPFEQKTPALYARVDNLVLHGKNLVPERIRLAVKSDLDFGIRALTRHATKTMVSIRIEQLEAHLRDVRFCVRRLVFPRWHDEGTAHIDMDGSTTYLEVNFLFRREASGTKLIFDHVKLHIKRFRIYIVTARNKTIDRVATSLLRSIIKKVVKTEIEEQVRTACFKLCDGINDVLRLLIRPS
eukprot:TRINITY_DN11912_c0_g1_i1.p1 TRINITY_DN11912_c0_g1~~TRINITY_DN11912_c0_g1_i1.p1  ORF type:complete len:340 (-),score=82.92 TRINITY_DN11912_c0_g1_i1:194-1213(-)